MNENRQEQQDEPLREAPAEPTAGSAGSGATGASDAGQTTSWADGASGGAPDAGSTASGAGGDWGGWPWQAAWPGASGAQPTLRRPYAGRMVGGVAAGVAEYTGIDLTIVRIVAAVLCVVGGAGVPLYLAAWLLIPSEGAEQSIGEEWLGHVVH